MLPRPLCALLSVPIWLASQEILCTSSHGDPGKAMSSWYSSGVGHLLCLLLTQELLGPQTLSKKVDLLVLLLASIHSFRILHISEFTSLIMSTHPYNRFNLSNSNWQQRNIITLELPDSRPQRKPKAAVQPTVPHRGQSRLGYLSAAMWGW